MRRTLTARTVGGAAFLALVIALLFFFMVSAISAGSDANDQAHFSDDRIAAAIEQQKLLVDMETGLRGYLITEEVRFLAPWNNAVASLPGTQGALSKAVQGDSAAEVLVRDIETDISEYQAEHGRPLIATVGRGGVTRDVRARFASEGKDRVDHLRVEFADLIASQRRAAADARSDAGEQFGRALLFGIFGLIGSVLLVVMFCGYQLRFVLRPVRRVARAARRLAGGDLSARVKERGGGEVGDLARAFNAMADSLEHNRDELESQNSELEAQQAEMERAVDELAQEKARIERLYTVGRAISNATELEDVAQVVVDQLAELAAAELGAVFVCQRGDRRAFAAVAARGLDPASLPWVVRNVGLAGRAVAENRMITAGLGESGISIKTLGANIVGRHEVHLPLVSGSDVVGVVTLVRVCDKLFDRLDLEVLDYLAGRAGAGIAAALTLREVRDQAALNRAVLDTAADAFVSIDSNGVITAWNSAAERMFGWSADEAIGLFLHDTIVPDRHAEHHERAIERVVAGGPMRIDGVPLELDAVRRDGHELPIEILISRLDRAGEVTFNAFIRDITARRRADTYMAAQYAVTRVLSEASTLAEARQGVLEGLGTTLGWKAGTAWLPDESGGAVLRATACWSEDGVDASELHQVSMNSAFEAGEGLPGRVWESGEPSWVEDVSRELSYPRASVARRAGLRGAIGFPVTSEKGVIGMVEFFSDEVERPDPELLSLLANIGAQIAQFSERKRAEMEADRLKDEFFALVSHELRTPLTSIIGYLEIVLEDPELIDPDAFRHLQVVERNSRRLHRLVGDLLFVAQVEAGRLSLDRTSIPLERIAHECVEAARPRAEENGVELRVKIDAAATCNGDGDRLGQMLDNLISNAVKFTPEGGHVDVRLMRSRDGERAVVEVRDTGVGVPEDEQGRLFQRFFRSTTATERAIPGVGLGLTISRAIVEAHGGSIDFESEEGRGTTFRVELPFDAALSSNDPSDTPQEVVL